MFLLSMHRTLYLSRRGEASQMNSKQSIIWIWEVNVNMNHGLVYDDKNPSNTAYSSLHCEKNSRQLHRNNEGWKAPLRSIRNTECKLKPYLLDYSCIQKDGSLMSRCWCFPNVLEYLWPRCRFAGKMPKVADWIWSGTAYGKRRPRSRVEVHLSDGMAPRLPSL